MKRLFRLFIGVVLTLAGALLMGSLPGLFPDSSHSFEFRGMNYVHTIWSVIRDLAHPNKINYLSNNGQHSIFPEIFQGWSYSLIILFFGFCSALLLATLLAFCTMILPIPMIKGTKGLLFFLESIPDVFIVMTIQLFEITIFHHTHIKLFDIYTYMHPLFVLPIITLAIPPAIMIYRMIILEIEEEAIKEYVELAKVKGLSQTSILFRHIFRNILLKTLLHARTILFFMISNLLIVEFIYLSGGLLIFLKQLYPFDKSLPDILTFSILLLMIPLASFLYICQLLANKIVRGDSL
jgi:ABC-type dipeptide/oligopeptide/nickel transport system permease component